MSASDLQKKKKKGGIAKGLFLTTVPTAVLIIALKEYTRERGTVPKCRATE